MTNILVVYYSHSGTTRKVAEAIRQQADGTLLEIEPEVPYPTPYNTVVEQAKKEIKVGYKPAIKTKVSRWDDYDTVFVGSPNWWSTIAPPIATFLSENDLSNKKVIPFCTHGGGGKGNIDRDIGKLCPHSTILDSLAFFEGDMGDMSSTITAWLGKIGVV
jgi:flavodoxin